MKEEIEDMTIKELKKRIKKNKKEHKMKMRRIRKMKKIRRKWRFSEKVIFGILLFSVMVFVSAMVYAYLKEDSSIWAYLIPSVGALASSGFAFFVWKEKSENLPKILANPYYDTEMLEEELKTEIEDEYKNLGR